MTLEDLVYAIDRNRESDEYIEICEDDWDTVTKFAISSRLLDPFMLRKITCLSAITKGTIRVELEWSDDD